MSYQILMAGSIPLAAPWNGADKNFARLLVQSDPENQYWVHTGMHDDWAENVIPIRSSHAGPMPTLGQKVRSFGYLARYTPKSDLVHLVASLSSSARWRQDSLRLWKLAMHKPVIHTVPSLGDLPVDQRNFIGDVTVVVSDYSLKKLTENGVPNVFRVYPPLDKRALCPVTRPEQLAADLSLGPHPVLYPAHYGPQSGIREMFQAFALLPEALQDAVLVLACRTHPSQDAAYEARQVMGWAEAMGIAERVRVVGNVVDMPAMISACLLTVLTPGLQASKMDLPLVVLESLALKRPVVISDQPPMDESLLGGGGIKVHFGDIRGLSSALAQLLSDQVLREKLAAQGASATLQLCHPKRVVEQYQQIYRRVFQPVGQLAEKRK